ncbi:MAG: FKBP-type peptidyl-prolyl cis-trans isomerase [Candidatus Hodarchaeales archaeon]|jgi:peptidylprolyl isomerase
MSVIKSGDKIQVHYKGTLEDGTVFDDSESKGTPLDFTVGSDQIILGFEQAVIGMREGETKEFTVSPNEGYGDPNPDYFREFPRNQIPKDMGEPEEGMVLQVGTPDGQTAIATIKSVAKENIILDLNHPLAGKTLKFTIKVLKVF